MKKTLTVFLPKTRTLDAVTVGIVPATELHGGQTSVDLSVTTTSGEIIGTRHQAGEYDQHGRAAAARPPAIAPGGGQQE